MSRSESKKSLVPNGATRSVLRVFLFFPFLLRLKGRTGTAKRNISACISQRETGHRSSTRRADASIAYPPHRAGCAHASKSAGRGRRETRGTGIEGNREVVGNGDPEIHGRAPRRSARFSATGNSLECLLPNRFATASLNFDDGSGRRGDRGYTPAYVFTKFVTDRRNPRNPRCAPCS